MPLEKEVPIIQPRGSETPTETMNSEVLRATEPDKIAPCDQDTPEMLEEEPNEAALQTLVAI
jgi:hypothetical protein